jgi:hypothetical protein
VCGACSTHGKINAYKIFVGKFVEKEPLGRYIRRWEVSIEEDLTEIV